MYKVLTKQARDVLLKTLQDYFTTDVEAVSLGLKWDLDPMKSSIFIADRYPDEMRKFPCVIIRAGAGGSQRMGFRNFSEYETTTADGTIHQWRRYTGKWHVPFTFSVASRSTLQRDYIVDLVIQCLDIDGWGVLQAAGLEQEPDSLSTGGDETFMVDPATAIEKVTIGAKYMLEWYASREIVGDTVGKVVLQKTVTSGVVLSSSH